MKRRYIIMLLSFLVAVVHFSSCDQSIDNLYTEKSRIQFRYYKEDTILQKITRTYVDRSVYSFGMAAEDTKEDTARIVVEFLGSAADRDRTYGVIVGSDSTTAVEGVHYKPISPTQTFRAGRMKDTLKIVVLRSNLNSSFITREDRRIALDLKPTDDFNLGMKGGLRTYLYLNNYLSQPIWWTDPLRGPYLGFYHPKKWKILISFNAKFSNKDKCDFDINNVGREYFNGLARYLDAVPTFDDDTGARIYMDKMVLQD